MEYNNLTNKVTPKIINTFRQVGSIIKVTFDMIYFYEGDNIASIDDEGNISSQRFHVTQVEGPIVYLMPIFEENQNTYDQTSLFPGNKFIKLDSSVLENQDRKVEVISPTPDKVETIEIKNGFKTTIKIKK